MIPLSVPVETSPPSIHPVRAISMVPPGSFTSWSIFNDAGADIVKIIHPLVGGVSSYGGLIPSPRVQGEGVDVTERLWRHRTWIPHGVVLVAGEMTLFDQRRQP